MLTYAFVELDLLVVAAAIRSANIKLKRFIEKCGFTYEGTLRMYGHELSDCLRYSMTRDEWKSMWQSI